VKRETTTAAEGVRNKTIQFPTKILSGEKMGGGHGKKRVKNSGRRGNASERGGNKVEIVVHEDWKKRKTKSASRAKKREITLPSKRERPGSTTTGEKMIKRGRRRGTKEERWSAKLEKRRLPEEKPGSSTSAIPRNGFLPCDGKKDQPNKERSDLRGWTETSYRIHDRR